MMKSVGLVLLLTAAFAYSGVEGDNACETALSNKAMNAGLDSAYTACRSDPAGLAALKAIEGIPVCAGYMWFAGDIKCEVAAAPYMKCVAGKLGYLNANGSINNTKILAQFKTWATSDPNCNVAQYNFAANKCGTTINNYAFVAKAVCIILATDQYTGLPAQSGPHSFILLAALKCSQQVHNNN
ncbi:uncharacterized protein LOC108672650 [Hyalella azteca]|uniref:Uncharacterized protein LOC108672650 n=1 Tax=Hyalella azteca TaxID=294128 RepID=A0A8B7NQ56_HYAAZ|nr:uncharacterized protein LOC108672650 [Hyalella azteca]